MTDKERGISQHKKTQPATADSAASDCRQPQEAGKDKEMDLPPIEFPEWDAADTLISSQYDSFLNFALQNNDIINSHCLRHQDWGNLLQQQQETKIP